MARKSHELFSNCPWETSTAFGDVTKESKSYSEEFKEPSNRTSTYTAFEETRDGQPKAYIPGFFRKPPFGYPRYKNLNYYRQLADSIYVDLVETAIIDEICSIPWDIVAEDEAGNDLLGKENEVAQIRSFFDNPNTNKESWETILRMALPDVLEINSGILVKTFNSFGKMVEIVARDGAAFTKNPDIYGMYTDRADLILIKDILREDEQSPIANPYPLLTGMITETQAHEEAAYFQYGWNSASRPTPFGKREIVWLEKKVRTDDLYGRSAMEVLAKTVQTLIYAVEHNMEYFSDNSIPPGVLGLDGMNTADMKAFAEQWIQTQKVQDDLGNWKRATHKLPMVNKVPTFERLGFTNQELELIESQKWWSKLVWGAFGMTSSELGFTEDAKGNANQIVQSYAAKKRIIYPLLRLIEYHVNTEIIPEFGVQGIKYKYKIFDVDEETKKWSLYKLQVEDAKLKTPNEIRNAEGLDLIEGGDDLRTTSSNGNNFYMGDPNQQEYNRNNQDAQDQRDQMTNSQKKTETKPFAGYENFDACVRANKDKKDPKAYCATIMRQAEGKAQNTDSPMILKPGEELDEKKLKQIISDFLLNNKKEIIAVLEGQTKEEPILRIKGIDDVPKLIKQVFQTFSLKSFTDEIIKFQFYKGWENSEKQINQNIVINEKALEFLQEHTFDNVKGMTEEIANDLKAELERGIINGEGITKLKERVNNVFNVGENRAEMISRTETNRAENNGKLLAMKGSGIKMKKKWISTEDDRTSELCKHLNGQIVEINEDFHHGKWSGQAPPAHVDCRSTIVFITEE